jgi:hypothetical protein
MNEDKLTDSPKTNELLNKKYRRNTPLEEASFYKVWRYNSRAAAL